MLARIFNSFLPWQPLQPRVTQTRRAAAVAAASSACTHTAPLEAPIAKEEYTTLEKTADYHSNGFAIVLGLLTGNDVEHFE